jgi:uncharacterized membrane protein
MRKWIPALLIIAAVVASIVAYPSLPERVPTHWGVNGEVNGWSSRFWGAWLMPLMMGFIWIIMRAIPHIDPRKENYRKFIGMYEVFISVTLAFMLAMHIVVLKAATGSHISIDKFVMAGVGTLFVAIGFFLPRVHPNWFVGIRTPWTLTSDLSWKRTHKVGGPLFMALGLIAIASAFVMPKVSVVFLVVAAVATTIFLFVYSYRVWKEDPLKHSV